MKKIACEENNLYLDELDKRLPHYCAASLHGFNLRYSEGKRVKEHVSFA